MKTQKKGLIKKSRAKGYLLVYDRCQKPSWLTMKEVADIARKGYILYDSSTGAGEPQVIHLGGNKNKGILKSKFIDVK